MAELREALERQLKRTQTAVSALILALADGNRAAVTHALLMAQAAHFFHGLSHVHHSAPEAEHANRLLDAANAFLDWQSEVVDQIAVEVRAGGLPSAADVAQRFEEDGGRRQAISDALR